MSPFDLINLALRSRHMLTSENSRNLLLGKSITLNSRSATNRTDMIDLTKPNAIWTFEDNSVPFDCSSNFGDQIHRLTTHLILWNIPFRTHYSDYPLSIIQYIYYSTTLAQIKPLPNFGISLQAQNAEGIYKIIKSIAESMWLFYPKATFETLRCPASSKRAGFRNFRG